MMTCEMSSTSMPRAAMSVATRIPDLAALETLLRAPWRAFWDLLPWIAAA